MRRVALTALLLLAAMPGFLHAGAAEDWAGVLALDAGPAKKPTSREEVLLLARNHLILQRKALDRFLASYPQDPRSFDARLRIAAIMAAEGKMNASPARVDEALLLLAELEKTPGIPPEKRADAGFQRVSLFMQSQSGSSDRMRDAIVSSAKNFTAKYPGDRRGPRLLVEAATLCDDVPNQKRDLLDQALALTTEEALKRRITDDFKRLDLLGKPLNLRLSTVPTGPTDLATLRGNVVILIFWSAESPHSLLWLREFRTAWEKMSKDQLRVVTISLDQNRRAFDECLRDLPSSWPAHFDGKGWASPLARSLGINALPSVWILDKKGVLRTLNARDSYETWTRQLLRE